MRIAKVLTVEMSPDTNSWYVQCIETRKIYSLGRESAIHYSWIRKDQILTVLLGETTVLSVQYPELDHLSEKLSGVA